MHNSDVALKNAPQSKITYRVSRWCAVIVVLREVVHGVGKIYKRRVIAAPFWSMSLRGCTCVPLARDCTRNVWGCTYEWKENQWVVQGDGR